MAHRALSVVLLTLVVSAGCLAGGPGGESTPTLSPTERTATVVIETSTRPVDITTTDAERAAETTATETATERGGFEPHDESVTLSILLTNHLDRWVEMRVEVRDQANGRRHTATYDVS